MRPAGADAVQWQHVQRHWREYKFNAHRRWSRLTVSELEATLGERAALAAKIRDVYAIPAAEAERQLADWHAALRESDPFG